MSWIVGHVVSPGGGLARARYADGVAVSITGALEDIAHGCKMRMKRLTVLAVCLCFVVTLGWIGYKRLQPSPPRQSLSLRSATLDEVGLVWQECLQSQEYFDWKEVEGCFGHSMPLLSEAEKARYGERIDLDNFQLAIGQDIYRTDFNKGLFPTQRYTLYRNGRPVKTLRGEFGAHSPNISLQNLGGRAVWGFADRNQATIVYDGQDIRQLYGLDKAYRPYSLAGKLIFIGQKGDKYFVVYDGLRIGPDFDKVVIAYCCEVVLYSVHFGEGRYLFSGTRGGQHYLVEITLSKD